MDSMTAPRGPMQEAAMPSAPEPDMDDSQVCVPLSSLAQPDDKEQMNTPAEGDSVSLQVDAQVVKIDGDNAYIKPTAINGVSLDDGDADTQPDATATPDNEGDDLRNQAKALS